MSEDNCGILTLEDGPFANCLENTLMSVDAYVENCAFDACVNMTNIRKAVCGTLEALSVICRTVVNWRTAADCRKYKDVIILLLPNLSKIKLFQCQIYSWLFIDKLAILMKLINNTFHNLTDHQEDKVKPEYNKIESICLYMNKFTAHYKYRIL